MSGPTLKNKIPVSNILIILHVLSVRHIRPQPNPTWPTPTPIIQTFLHLDPAANPLRHHKAVPDSPNPLIPKIFHLLPAAEHNILQQTDWQFLTKRAAICKHIDSTNKCDKELGDKGRVCF